MNSVPSTEVHDDSPFDDMIHIQQHDTINMRSLDRIRTAVRDRTISSGNNELNIPSSPSLESSIGLIRGNSLEFLGQEKDVREELFESIPAPYPHSTNFQRLIITDTGDAADPDAIEGCRKLRLCMNLREKYLSKHPFPPQDLEEIEFHGHNSPKGNTTNRKNLNANSLSEYNTSDVIPITPFLSTPMKRTTTTTTVGSTTSEKFHNGIEYRRRSVPVYDVFNRPLPDTIHHLKFNMVDGVVSVVKVPTKLHHSSTTSSKDHSHLGPLKLPDYESTSSSSKSDKKEETAIDWSKSVFPVIKYDEFVTDFNLMRKIIYSGPVASYAYQHQRILEAKFNLHVLLNETRELDAQKSVPHRDFYNVRKVDTHVHHSACMNQKHLLRFIKHKLKQAPNEAVVFRDGKFLTLGEVFKSLNLTAYDLSIDTLDMHANNTFHRFDRFNLKYNPAGQSRLREIFLKTDNVISGSYLAQLTSELIDDLNGSKYQLVEWRISIYGRKASEWAALARWFYVNRLAHNNVRWLIQVPRLYDAYRKSGEIKSFGQLLNNIFLPLFAVSIDPASNLPLHYFLQTVVGIDSVDDESRPENAGMMNNLPTPENWTSSENPPYGYWMYYMYANLCVLNNLRASRGLCTFQFRPHCGEAGDVDHLVSTYLLAHQINHGILLRKNAVLLYLYYLSQVGIAMSPLSNNKLFLDYNKNPFPRYFQIGMNVSLSTDDPLMLHYTKDALLEEYSVATQLSAADQCEIARNSVLQSGWECKFKKHFLGSDLCDIRETNVPEIRLQYRRDTLNSEIQEIEKYSSL
eukprot:gene7929-10762_t